MACSDDKKQNYYTIRIPSMGMKMYSDPTSFRDIEEVQSIAFIDISPTPTRIQLPRRFGGKIDVDQLSKESRPPFHRPSSRIAEILRKRRSTELNALGKFYSSKQCASPKCNAPIEDGTDHLHLCPEHHRELQGILKQTRDSFKLTLLQPMEADDLHDMAYHSLLPSIDRLLEEIKEKNDGIDRKRIQEILFIFKALIYIYRMHLNDWNEILQTFIEVINHVLKQSPDQLTTVFQHALGFITAILHTLGIRLIVMVDDQLRDKRTIGMLLTGFGAASAGWGITQIVITSAASAMAAPVIVPFAPFAAAGLGLATMGLGVWIIVDRIRRRPPQPGLVDVNLWLNNNNPYLEQEFH